MSSFIAFASSEDRSLSPAEQIAAIGKMCAESAEAINQRQAESPLYARLGGREGLHKFSTQLYEAHASNEQIGHMFREVPQGNFVKNVTEFLAVHSGGGGEYAGRTMKDVHLGLDISHENFLAAGGDVQQVMKGLGYGENEIQEAVCFLVSYVPDVVTR